MATHERTATRFFWTVLLCATGVSIGGNAIHATLNTTSVPPALAAAVATVPPLVLLAATEGLSLLMRTRRGPSAAYWCALGMTGLLAVCAFVLSFDALRDLAGRAGVRQELSWLWPIAVDASIAQCTVALLSLSRRSTAARVPLPPAQVTVEDEDSQNDSAQANVADAAPRDPWVDEIAAALVENGRTRQPPDVIAEVLSRTKRGQKPSQIGADMGIHHSTVNRVLNAQHRLKIQHAHTR